jgi:hypothetical protein
MTFSGCCGTVPHHKVLSGTSFHHWPLSPTAHQQSPPATVAAFSWPILVDLPACPTVMDGWEAYTSPSANSDQPGEPPKLLALSSDFPETDHETTGPSAQMDPWSIYAVCPPSDTQPTLPQTPGQPLSAPAQAQAEKEPKYPLHPQGRCSHKSHWQHLRAKRNHSYYACLQCSKTWRQWRPGKEPAAPAVVNRSQ